MSETTPARLSGKIWKRNAGFLRAWHSRAAIVTIDGFLVYKKNTNAIKSKKIDLIKTTFTGSIVQGSGYFYFELQCGSAQMAIGFPAIEDARLWLSGMMEAADENSAGRRLWMANLRHMLTLRLQDRWELVSVMTNRDWYSEWNFCLRALRDEEEPILSRQRRLRRLHTIWLQFELFSEILAEMFLSSVQQRDAHGHKPDISQQKETSKDNDCGRGSKYFKRNDVDEMKFAGIHLQFASKSWQGHKRLAKEMTLFSKFRSLIEVFLSEKQPSLLQAALVRLPTFPLISAFSIQDVNVVAIAEPLQIDQSILMTIDKRDLTDLSVALREAKLLQFFPYQELPKLVVRQFLSQTSTSTLVTIHSRFDDVLVNSLRSSMVHGVLVRAADSVSESSSQIELMSAHDLKELIATKKPTWIPYLDLVYYQLNSESCPVKNFASEKFLLQSGSHRSHPLTGDIVFTFDTKNSKLPLDLPEAFVRNHEMDLCSLVQKLQEVKKNTALFNFTSSNSTLSRSQIGQLRPLDSSMQVAREFEDAVKKLFVQHIKDFAAQLLTLGDFCRCEVDGQFEDPTKKTSQGMRLMRSNTMSSMPRPRDVFASSAALKSNEFESESGSIAQPRLQQRTSSLSSIPLTHEATKSTDHTLGTYVIDTIHLRQTMRESGVNVRFLPLVFHYLGSHKQQGVQVLVASEIVARLAKNWFRYQMLNEDTGKKNCWKSRKWRLIRLINSIMHGLFHKNLPCVVSECSGDQFWNIDGPILYLLGAFSSSFAMDPHVLSNVANPGVIFDKYRDLLRMSPSILFNNLLFVFQAQLIPSILTKLHENRFMSLPFLQTEADLSFEYEDQDPKFAIHIHENLLWSHLHFFQVLYETLKPALPNPEKQINKIGSMQWTQYYRTLSSIFRQSIGHSHLTRLENAIQSWQDLTSVRVLLTFALRAADIYIRHLSDNQDTLSSIRKHCHNAHERMASSKALFPIEYKLVLLCLELMCTGIEPVNALNDSNELQEWLKIFYRPANSSQFLKNSSSHPLFSVLYTASMKRSEQSSAELSLRDKFQDQQYQQLWTSSMTVANAYCRRIKHIRQNPITLAATTAVLREFKNTDPYDSIKLNVSRTGKNQISGLTSQSSTTPSINSFRGDVLQFIECFLLPPFATHSLRVAGCALANNNDIVSLLPSTLHQTISKSPVPGFALMWGNPLGLSLDDEAQISREPHMKSSLRPRPETAASICTLSFPPSIRCVVQIACGYRHTALITDDRLLYTFGHGECGRLGHGTEESCHDPKPVSYFLNLIAAKGVAAGIVDVSCGREHTMVVTANGHLFGFGWGEAGRLGTGETGSTLHPSRVELTNITKVACGREHTLALNRKGQVFAFGAGFQGRLGTGYETDEKFPAIVEGLDGYIITAMDAGECHSCALSTNGTIFTWGFGHSGALGHNSRDNCLKPTLVTGPWSNNEQVSEDDTPSKEVLVTFISCGGYHTLATTSNGVLYGWGDAAAGQLGPECLNAPDFVILSPTIIRTPTFSKINNISCGMFTSAMCNTQGQLFMWGSPAAGNGASLPEDDAEIKKIDFLDEFDFAQIACGAYHAVAITRKLELSNAVSFHIMPPASTTSRGTSVLPQLRPKRPSPARGILSPPQVHRQVPQRFQVRNAAASFPSARHIETILYFWTVVAILFGILLACLVLFLLFCKEGGSLTPTLPFDMAAYGGVAITTASCCGLYGLLYHKKLVTEGRRNYALGTFIVLGTIGAIIVIIAGAMALSLVRVVAQAQNDEFMNDQVIILETHVISRLHAQVKESKLTWRSTQNQLECCGYLQSSVLSAFLSARSSWDTTLETAVNDVNAIGGKFCSTRISECDHMTSEAFCPVTGRGWCRNELLRVARDNYRQLGICCVTFGGAQWLITDLQD
ncbi:FOG: RCC1 domain [Plasmopara halstedii]|uniref:FOG: RCC1 domain n=1 Tax=Plasmopara halstedii TaxID=4781 RepID=A0A0P1AQZ9_PLAHL|nr:FOG: RCC1 domain [Plasmopara halstedii]CEG43334.1 FOG: RCC1 domain [Plasmopara halstedii]|eukprot:XP_024579703.1 FOG: RCC1 domain [Plasmopara halstedii]